MRKLNLFTSVLIGLLLGLTACGGKEDSPKPAPNPVVSSPATMSAMINGVAFTALNPSVDPANPSGISINGQQGDKIISISVMGIIKPGKFDAFGYETLSGWYMEKGNGTMLTWTSITSRNCKLEITKLDWTANTMSGTFSFVADSQASSSPSGRFTITNGVFTDLPIKVTKPAATVKMEAQVDNGPWNASGTYIYGFPGNYTLTGSDSNGHLISIDGITSLAPGNNANTWAYYLVPTGNDYQMWSSDFSNPPTFTITSYDPVGKKASGTYTFTGIATPLAGATGSKTITQGLFTDVPVY